MNYLINGVRGFCMALADSVPGVSGGTIAFILGFYDQFINSLNNLVFGNKKEKKEALFFLLKLGIGWVIGMVLAILVLTSFLQIIFMKLVLYLLVSLSFLYHLLFQKKKVF